MANTRADRHAKCEKLAGVAVGECSIYTGLNQHLVLSKRKEQQHCN